MSSCNSSSLSMVEAKLPAGFRFHPKDEELICDYLINKVLLPHDQQQQQQQHLPLLIEVDLNKTEPWDIPEVACVGGKDWYFYSQRDRKYATGLRTNRATVTGYWKATGKDRPITRKGTLMGMRKTLVFYQGRAPKGRKSDWVMHEFRLEGPHAPSQISSIKEDWVLCRVFHKNKETLAIKQGTVMNNYHDDTISSSSHSLPPLTDSFITFNQTQPNTNTMHMHDQYNYNSQQVPCFSIYTPAQIFSHGHITTATTTTTTTTTAAANAACGGFPADVKAVLSQLSGHNSVNMNGGGSPSFGEGSAESVFLSEVGLSTMWNHY